MSSYKLFIPLNILLTLSNQTSTEIAKKSTKKKTLPWKGVNFPPSSSKYLVSADRLS